MLRILVQFVSFVFVIQLELIYMACIHVFVEVVVVYGSCAACSRFANFYGVKCFSPNKHDVLLKVVARIESSIWRYYVMKWTDFLLNAKAFARF